MNPNDRVDFPKQKLKISELCAHPLDQFTLWYENIKNQSWPQDFEDCGFSLSTASSDSKPSSRIVLMTDFTIEGLVFFTNYNSQKGTELALNPFACALFWWPKTCQQVRIEGSVQKVSASESDEYFHSRPFESQVASCVSQQSETIGSSDELLSCFDSFIASHDVSMPVARPNHWGGYRLIPERYEFWQGASHRLSDRFEYRMKNDEWNIRRLSP